MLFHVISTHTPENCPAHRLERLQTYATVIASAEENGIHIHSLHAASWQHTVYGVVEADSAENLDRWLNPLFEMGSTTITPVIDFSWAIERRLKEDR